MQLKPKLKNHFHLKNVFLLFICFLTIAIGCKKQIDNKQNDDQINLLKNWYNAHSSSFNASSKTFAQLKPDFNTAYTAVKEGTNVTELNFDKPNAIIFTTGITDDKTKEKLRANTLIKLVLFNIPKTQEVRGAYMVLNADDGSLSSVHYEDFEGFNGTIKFYNLDGSFENGYQILNGKIEKTFSKLDSSNSNLINLNDTQAAKIARQNVKPGEKLMQFNANGGCNIATSTSYGWQCVSINNHPDIPVVCSITQGDTESWLVCEGGGVGNDIGGGGYTGTGNTGQQNGGGGSSGGTTMTMPPPPDKPIADMAKFLSCLDKSKPASLTIYTEKVFTSFPGHAFVSITQGNNTMVFGFYPKKSFPATFAGPGVMGENGGHAYDLAKDYNISAEQLRGIISLAVNYSLSDYDLYATNCADVALDIANVAGDKNDSSGRSDPNTVYNLIEATAQHNRGNAPQTNRNCP